MKIVIVASVDDVVKHKITVEIPPEFKADDARDLIKEGIGRVHAWFYEEYPLDIDALINDPKYKFPVLGIAIENP